MAKKKFYLYVGYYEVFITTRKMGYPYQLDYKFQTADEATEKVEEYYPSATILYDEDAMRDMRCDYVVDDEENEPIVDEEGMVWWQF